LIDLPPKRDILPRTPQETRSRTGWHKARPDPTDLGGEQELGEEPGDFFEAASLGFHWIGSDGIILGANQAELDLLGYSKEEFIGRNIAEFHVEREVIEDILRRLEAGEVVRNREASMRCKDGSIKHVLIDSSVLWNDGRCVRIRCFTLDITDRRRAEEAQARLAAIVESSQDAIVGKTLEGRIVSWNASAEQLFGYRADEVIGKSITMLIPPDLQFEELAILEKLRHGERIDHYETVRVGKDGRRIEVSLSISPIRDGAGRVIGASKIARDITLRKRDEQRLATQYGVTQALAESATLGDAASRILYAVCGHLGWKVGVLWYVDRLIQGLRCAQVYHRPNIQIPEFERSTRESVFERGIGLPGRVWETGKPVWIRDVVTDFNFPLATVASAEGLHAGLGLPITLNQEVLGVMEFFSEEIRQPEPDVIDMMNAIAGQIGQFIERKRVEESLRTTAAENARLLASLQETDQRKDEFLAMLAHELRNPLAPIRNAVQIIRRKGLPVPELQWSTEVIHRQVSQMSRLVDDLLDISRITRGKVEMRKETVDLSEVLNSALEVSRPLIEKWGHKLTISLPPHPVRLFADPTRLTQVFLNLLNNAAKYTDQGGHIELKAELDGGAVVVTVKDNGIGIAPEMLPRIFEPFAQVDRSLARAQGGLGIGLTLVQRLLAFHGGSIEARSEGPGKGSEFVARIPLAYGPEAGASAGESPKNSASAFPSRRILIVDDNKDAADSLGMLMRMLGHEVHTAHDGLEAVGAAATFQPEVVLLDIGLPKLNGYEAAVRIREQKGCAGVRLIALTGWGQSEDRRRSQEAGFDYHLTKPVEIALLQEMLARPISDTASASPDPLPEPGTAPDSAAPRSAGAKLPGPAPDPASTPSDL
jgi:PAS domain S-box-containing protein